MGVESEYNKLSEVLGGVRGVDGLLKGLPFGVFGFGESHGKGVGQDVGEFACGYGELGQMGFKPDALGGAVESVCKVVGDVVADVVPACDNCLVLDVGSAAVVGRKRPRSGKVRELAYH